MPQVPASGLPPLPTLPQSIARTASPPSFLTAVSSSSSSSSPSSASPRPASRPSSPLDHQSSKTPPSRSVNSTPSIPPLLPQAITSSNMDSATTIARTGMSSSSTTTSSASTAAAAAAQNIPDNSQSRTRNKKKLGISVNGHYHFQSTLSPFSDLSSPALTTPMSALTPGTSTSSSVNVPNGPGSSSNGGRLLHPVLSYRSTASSPDSTIGSSGGGGSTTFKILNTLKSATPRSAISAQTSTVAKVSSNARYYADEETRAMLHLLIESDAKFEEVVELGFPSNMEEYEKELSDDININAFLHSPISVVPRERTLKITLTPSSMRADEDTIYGWQNDANIDSGTIKSLKSLSPPTINTGAQGLGTPGTTSGEDTPSSSTGKLPISPQSPEPVIVSTAYSTSAPASLEDSGASKMKRMFGKLRKPKPTPNASIMITSADIQASKNGANSADENDDFLDDDF